MDIQPKPFDLNVNGIRLRCHDWGGTGSPILLLHGTGMLAVLLRPIAMALTTIGRVYSYDRRGHGDSAHPADAAYNWNADLEDLDGVIRALGLRNLRALGHSAGATLMGALAAERPEVFARAIMAEPVLFELSGDAAESNSESNSMIERTRRRRRAFDSAEAMFANFENKPPFHTWRRDILWEYCRCGAAANPEGKWELKCPPEIEASFYATAQGFSTLERVLRCRIPLMVLFGTRGGESTGAAFSGRITAEMPDAQIVNFPQAGHFLPLEQSETVARLALEFFTRT